MRVYVGDVANLLRRRAAWDAVLLDIDNGPEWIVQRRNQTLYGRRAWRLVVALPAHRDVVSRLLAAAPHHRRHS